MLGRNARLLILKKKKKKRKFKQSCICMDMKYLGEKPRNSFLSYFKTFLIMNDFFHTKSNNFTEKLTTLNSSLQNFNNYSCTFFSFNDTEIAKQKLANFANVEMKLRTLVPLESCKQVLPKR